MKGKKKGISDGSIKPNFHRFNCRENIERYRKIIQQRIVAVREEASRKYGNLLESIPSRLEQIFGKEDPEPTVEDAAEVEGDDNWRLFELLWNLKTFSPIKFPRRKSVGKI